MTDAKQALEVAEDLRIGLAEMAASCSVNMETWDRFSNNVLDAASLLSSLAEENERLRGELDSLRWAIMGGEDAPGVLDTVTHEEVLEALQESRSNWKSYAEMVAAECNRLSAALGEAERAINRAKEAVEDQDDIELVGSLDAALSTLKTAREG